MSLDFSALSQEVTPESLKADLAARLAAAGVEVDTREGSYTDILFAKAAYLNYKVWQQAQVVLAAAVPGEDSGPYLDDFGGQFGMSRTPASTAHVTLQFTGEDGSVIPAGTVVLTAGGLRYTTDLQAVIAGGTATASATAEEAGEAYNAAPGTVTRFLVTVPGVTAVTNPAAGEGGADQESDSSYYERIHTRLSKPVGSGNAYYYEQLARTVPGVGQAKTIPIWDGPGTVKVVVASEDKQPLDEHIVTQVQQVMEEGRVIGADVTVVSAQALEINVTATCVLEAGVLEATVETELKERLEEMFEAMEFGGTDPIRYNQVALRLLSCSGVSDYSNLQVNGGAANVTKTQEQVPVVGTVTITKG